MAFMVLAVATATPKSPAASASTSAETKPPAQSSNTPEPLERRLSAARAALAMADAAKPRMPDEQAAAVERMFDLLDEADRLDTEEAQALANRDPALRHTAAETDAVAHALQLERSARVQFARRELAAALVTSRRALDTLHHAGSNDDAEASILRTQGAILSVQSKYVEAANALETAIARLDAHRIVDRRLALALQGLGYARSRLGKLDAAQSAFDRATAVATSLDGGDGVLSAEIVAMSHIVPDTRGDFAAALKLLDQALPILRAAQPAQPALLARAQYWYAGVLFDSADLVGAERILHELINQEEPHPSLAGLTLADAYNLEGWRLIGDERIADAEPWFKRALAIDHKVLDADSDAVIFCENNLAMEYKLLRRFDEAVPLLQHVVEVVDRAPPGSWTAGTPARVNLGDVYLQQGRYAQAEQMYRSFLARIGPGNDVLDTTARGAMAGIAASLWGQGRNDAAFAQAIAMEQSRQKLLRTAGADLGERQGLSMSEGIVSGLSWTTAIAAQNRDPSQVRKAWELALETRGLVGTTGARRRAVARAASDPRLAAVWKHWKQLDEGLVQARVDLARDPSPKALTALDAAEHDFDAVERELASATGSSGAALAQVRTTLETVLKELPAETLLVSYLETESSEPKDWNVAHVKQHPRLYAFAATRDAAPQLIDLAPRETARDGVARWLELVADRNAGAAERAAAGQRVRELVWDPIARRWPQHRVLVVPSAAVDRAPFAALPAADGRYLVETGYAFHLLDHERDVLMTPASTGERTLSLIGAPDFGVDTRLASEGMRGVCAGLRGATFSPLPQATREIEQLRTLWTQQSGAGAPTVLTGTDANEARARAALPGSRIVHFATHGIFLGDQCKQASADTRGLKTVDTAQQTTRDGMQDLSALVLSGANRPASSTENDGLLTSEEIAALDLTGIEWAVLSACDSGIGSSTSTEGVLGLRRAFRLAGARTVVMSLWPVDDSASADWMVALYRARLQEHATTMDSARSADLALIKQRRDAGLDPAPYYWAAFVAAGDWR
jgi:CHAT domain-containing protein/tetratricopeptide (TPR) repeat protein